MGILILGISVIIIFLNMGYLKDLRINGPAVKSFGWFIPFIIYLLFVQLMHCLSNPENSEVYINTLYNNFNVFIRAIILCAACIAIVNKYRFSSNEFYRMLISVCCIQLVCVLLALLFPSVRQFFNNLTIVNSKYDYMQVATSRTLLETYPRGYGLSYNLYDAFGYITSILITLTFIFGIDSAGKSGFILLAISMLIMEFLNTRTGIFLTIIGLSVSLIAYIRPSKIIKYTLILIVGLLIMNRLTLLLPEVTKEWINAGMSQTTSLIFERETVGIYDAVLDKNIIFPDDIVFGAGGFPHYLIDYNTDNGYINCIWNFGIVGTIALFVGYIHMFYSAYRFGASKMTKTLIIAMSIIFFFYSIKLYSITLNGANVLIFCIPVIILYNSNEGIDVATS